ncbi:unnamed protein product [Closterium sp. Yama58-4]|nr:unnamed protein product [Closterium sp. Yama58-4]
MVYWALLTDLIAAVSSTVTDASFFPRVFLKLLKAGWTCCTSPCRLYAKACKASAYPLPSRPNSSSSGGWFSDHTHESVRSHHASCSGVHPSGPPSAAAADAAANESAADLPASEGVEWLVESQERMGPEGCLQTDIPLSQGEQQEQKRRQQLRWRKRLTATFRSRYTKSASAVETSRNATAGAGVGRKGSAVNGRSADAADGVASPCSPDAVTPIVLVHGIFGFGHGKFGGISYFGGAEYRHDKVLVPDLGSLTSIHDRARDLFYYLKGGTVDYGAEHSAAAGHDRFGKTYAQGKHPLWDAQHPIHLVAHSSGVQAARMLQHMLHNKEFEGHDDTSADWVASITSLSGALNGTTRVYIDGLSVRDGVTVRPMCLLQVLRIGSIIFEWLDIAPLKAFYSFGFDHFPLSWRRVGLWGLVKALAGKTGPFASGDWVLPDLSLHHSMELNKKLQTHPNTYYFSYATVKTRNLMGWVVPAALSIHPIFTLRSLQLCLWRLPKHAPKPYPNYRDKDWWHNDGALNTISMLYPRFPTPQPHSPLPRIQPSQGTPPYKPGIWYFSLLEADHILFIISRQRAGVRFDVLYDSIFHRCRTDLAALSIIASADSNAATSASSAAETAAAVASVDGGWLGAEQGQMSGEGEEEQEGVGLALSEVAGKVNSGAATKSRSYRLVTSSSTPSFLPSDVASPRGECEKAGSALSRTGLGLDGARAATKCREIVENGVMDGEEGSTDDAIQWAPQYKWTVGENEVEEVEGKELGHHRYQEQEEAGARVDGCHECDKQQRALAAVVDLFGAPLTNVCVCSLRNGRGGSGKHGSRSGSGMRSSMSLDFLGDMWLWNGGGKGVSSGRAGKGKENTGRIRKVTWWEGADLHKHNRGLLSLEGEDQDGGSNAVRCGAGGVMALDWGSFAWNAGLRSQFLSSHRLPLVLPLPHFATAFRHRLPPPRFATAFRHRISRPPSATPGSPPPSAMPLSKHRDCPRAPHIHLLAFGLLALLSLPAILTSEAASRTPAQAEERAEMKRKLNEIGARHPIVVVGRSYCRDTRRTRALLEGLAGDSGGTIWPVNVDGTEEGPGIENAAEVVYGTTAMPQVRAPLRAGWWFWYAQVRAWVRACGEFGARVFIGGRYVGGKEQVMDLHERGKLKPMVDRALGGGRELYVDLRFLLVLVATLPTTWLKRHRHPRLVTVKVLLEAARRTSEAFKGTTAFVALHSSRRRRDAIYDVAEVSSIDQRSRGAAPRVVLVLMGAARRIFEVSREATAFGVLHASWTETEEQLHGWSNRLYQPSKVLQQRFYSRRLCHTAKLQGGVNVPADTTGRRLLSLTQLLLNQGTFSMSNIHGSTMPLLTGYGLGDLHSHAREIASTPLVLHTREASSAHWKTVNSTQPAPCYLLLVRSAALPAALAALPARALIVWIVCLICTAVDVWRILLRLELQILLRLELQILMCPFYHLARLLPDPANLPLSTSLLFHLLSHACLCAMPRSSLLFLFQAAAHHLTRAMPLSKHRDCPRAPHIHLLALGLLALLSLPAILTSEAASRTPAQAEERAEMKRKLNEIGARHPIVVVGRSYCRDTRRTRALLEGLAGDSGGTIWPVNVDGTEEGPGIENAAEVVYGTTAMPQVFIGGRYVGGKEQVMDLHERGKLKPMVDRALGGGREL